MLVSKNKWIKKTLEKSIPNVFNFFILNRIKLFYYMVVLYRINQSKIPQLRANNNVIIPIKI